MTLLGPPKALRADHSLKDWPVLRTQGDHAKRTIFLELRDHAEALGEHVDDNQILGWELSCV